jgi:DNA-binding transcriptional regulator LsrR (DeoR family)
MLDLLADPMDAKSLAEKLNVSTLQAKAWLKRAVQEGRIKMAKPRNPVRYVRASTSLPLFTSDSDALNKGS